MEINEKVKQFSEKMWAINSLVSRDDFVKAFEMLVKVVVRVEESLIKKIDAKLATLKDGPQGPKGDKGDSVQGPKGEKGERGPVGPMGASIIGPQGMNGKDGSPDTPEQIREKILPLAIEDIKNLREELDELRRLRQTLGSRMFGSGGTSAMGVASALGYVGKKETPTGAIDGVNLVYTVSKPINFVFSFSINGQVISDDLYTVAGRTITFSTAIDSSLSGTSYRIHYV